MARIGDGVTFGGVLRRKPEAGQGANCGARRMHLR